MSGPGETERVRLEEIYGDREPPAELEEAVLADFRAGAGGTASRGGASTRGWPLRLAAALVLFAAGWGASSWSGAGPGAAAPAGARYMLLLWEGEDFQAGSTPSAHAAEYGAWAARMGRDGRFVTGAELDPARVLLGEQEHPGGAVARVSGYFVVEAASIQEAADLAGGHPHVGYGGWIEVAPVVSR